MGKALFTRPQLSEARGRKLLRGGEESYIQETIALGSPLHRSRPGESTSRAHPTWSWQHPTGANKFKEIQRTLTIWAGSVEPPGLEREALIF
jgi:hypothetical protein